MTKLRRISLLVLVLLLIVAVFLFSLKIEWVEKHVDLGPSAEVKRQEYLAAQKFLEKLDVALTVEQGYTRLDASPSAQYIEEDSELKVFPSVNDLVVISDGYTAISEIRSKKLLSWVESGGSLIVTSSNPFLSSVENRKDFIFDSFGVFPLEVDLSNEQLSDDEQYAKDSENQSGLDGPVEADSGFNNEESNKPGSNNTNSEHEAPKRWSPQTACQKLTNNMYLNIYGDVEIELGLNARKALSFEEEREENFFFWSSNDQGIQIIQANYGDGVVTFLTGLDLWKNNYIACFDNAYFLQFFAESSGHVWFLINRDSPSLAQLIWLKYPYFLFGLTIFIALMIWHYGQRFGGVIPKEPLNRRKILEHIEASSLFLWRYKTTRWLLVETVQYSIKKKMLLRNAGFERKTQAQQCDLLAQATKIPVEEISTAMLELTDEVKSQTLTEQNFIVLMKSLKRIEGKL